MAMCVCLNERMCGLDVKSGDRGRGQGAGTCNGDGWQGHQGDWAHDPVMMTSGSQGDRKSVV